MRLKSPWGDAHIALKRLWDERISATGMSQEEFGEKYGIGTQGMVSQYLRGSRPLNYDAAAKFAKGLGCSIEEICPPMAETLRKEIVPLLRRSLRRRRALASFVAAGLIGLPAICHNSFSEAATVLNTHCMLLLRRFWRSLVRPAFQLRTIA